jgi:hypothetical protein
MEKPIIPEYPKRSGTINNVMFFVENGEIVLLEEHLVNKLYCKRPYNSNMVEYIDDDTIPKILEMVDKIKNTSKYNITSYTIRPVTLGWELIFQYNYEYSEKEFQKLISIHNKEMIKYNKLLDEYQKYTQSVLKDANTTRLNALYEELARITNEIQKLEQA